jgi:hypothetical protein
MIGQALKRLCAFHTTVEMTPFVLDTWCAALSVYEPAETNRAILEIGLGVDPFPSVGKIIDRIHSNRAKYGSQVSTTRKPGTLPPKQVSQIAAALSIDIGN